MLPLIRNTPYGKRIQNKLQREQLDQQQQHFNGFGAGGPALMMGAGGAGGRHHGHHGHGQGYGRGHGHRGHGHGHGQHGHGHGQHHGHGQNHVANHLADVYGAAAAAASNAAMYSQAGFGQSPTIDPQMLHNMAQLPPQQQQQTIDGYVLQRDSAHHQGLHHQQHLQQEQQQSQPQYPGAATYASAMPGFGGDPYQRSTFGYTM